MHVTSASLASLRSPAQMPQHTRLTGPYGLDVSLPPYYSVLGGFTDNESYSNIQYGTPRMKPWP